MAHQLITLADLQQFKIELIAELTRLLTSHAPEPPKQWLKSYEVRKIMGISRGTLQTLRTNGTLKATKIGGLMFYAADDISKLMQGPNNQDKR
ncbi:MAG TPA: helix-turn-helix domain-containing protein [Ginsengibacter sp.]